MENKWICQYCTLETVKIQCKNGKKQFGNERQTKQKTCVYVLCIHAENRGKDRWIRRKCFENVSDKETVCSVVTCKYPQTLIALDV